jgi:hypothetical protein
VPANRSRTERWRESLQQIFERGGGLELAVASRRAKAALEAAEEIPGDLVWRVRVLHLDEDRIIVEHPAAMGQTVRIGADQDVICSITVGQNRWMFRTRTEGDRIVPVDRGRVAGLCLKMPTQVERCQRRNFCRVSTAELFLPAVECWPLLSPTAAITAEIANRALILQAQHDGVRPGPSPDADPLLADVGPRFNARLMNIGGGGVGLIVDRSESAGLDRSRLFWLRINLVPRIPAPIGLTAKLAHTHVDSEQNVHAGFAFEFSYHAEHRDFVVSQFQRAVAEIQRLNSLEAEAA